MPAAVSAYELLNEKSNVTPTPILRKPQSNNDKAVVLCRTQTLSFQTWDRLSWFEGVRETCSAIVWCGQQVGFPRDLVIEVLKYYLKPSARFSTRKPIEFQSDDETETDSSPKSKSREATDVIIVKKKSSSVSNTNAVSSLADVAASAHWMRFSSDISDMPVTKSLQKDVSKSSTPVNTVDQKDKPLRSALKLSVDNKATDKSKRRFCGTSIRTRRSSESTAGKRQINFPNDDNKKLISNTNAVSSLTDIAASAHWMRFSSNAPDESVDTKESTNIRSSTSEEHQSKLHYSASSIDTRTANTESVRVLTPPPCLMQSSHKSKKSSFTSESSSSGSDSGRTHRYTWGERALRMLSCGFKKHSAEKSSEKRSLSR